MKPIFNLHITYEDAMCYALRFQDEHKDLYLWDDPRDIYGQRITFRTDALYPTKHLDANLAELFEVGTVDEYAKKALVWLINKHDGFNCLELGQVIVGIKNHGFGDDYMVAVFAYLSKEDDCLRDFITELAYDL